MRKVIVLRRNWGFGFRGCGRCKVVYLKQKWREINFKRGRLKQMRWTLEADGVLKKDSEL